jgi:hypothetical protein
MKRSTIYTLTDPQLINKFSASYGTQVHYRTHKSPPFDPTGKAKAQLIICHKDIEGKLSYSSTLSLTSALDRVCGQRKVPAALPLGKRPGTHCIGDLVDPRAGLGRCGKPTLPPGFDPRTVQPLATRYTDCDIPAHPTVPTLNQFTHYLQPITHLRPLTTQKSEGL